MAAEQLGDTPRNPDGLEPLVPSPDGVLISRLNPQDVAQHLLSNAGIVNHSFNIYENRGTGKRGLIGEILHMAGTPDQVLHALDWGRNEAANYSLMARILSIPIWQAWMVGCTGRGDNTPRLDLAANVLTEPETLIGETAPYIFSFWNLIGGYDKEIWTRMYQRLWRDADTDFESLTTCDPDLAASLAGNYDPERDFDRAKEDPNLAASVASDAVLGGIVEGPKSIVFNTAWKFAQTEYKLGIDFPMNWYTGARRPDRRATEKQNDYEFADTIGHIAALATEEIIGARVISQRKGIFTYLTYFEDPEGKPLTIDWIQNHPYTSLAR